MALDTLIEVAGRAIAQFVLERIIVGVFYWPGWFVLRIITLGHYPPSQTTPHNREFVALFAVAISLAAITIYYWMIGQ